MRPTSRLRSSVLILGALAWISSPVVLHAQYASSSAGHSGGSASAGGHSSGGHSGGSSGGHGGYASGSSGHAGSSGRSGSSGADRSGPYVSSSSGSASGSGGYTPYVPAMRVNGSAGGAQMSFAPRPDAPRGAAEQQSLERLARNGWTFLPSSGVSPAAVTRVASNSPAARSGRLVRPVSSGVPIGRVQRGAPYIISQPIFPNVPALNPGFGFGPGFGPGGNCFFDGFSTGCNGGGFGFFGQGCRWRHRCPGFGYGYGYGYGLFGYGYGGYDLQNYEDQTIYPADDGSRVDIAGPFIGELGESGVSPSEETSGPPAQLVFRNGSAYAVKAYWIQDGQLYYQPVYGGTNHVPLDQLDLPATVEANSRAGVPFSLSTVPPLR